MFTPDEIQRYHRDGYVIPQSFRLSDAELKTLRDAVNRVLEDNADVLPDRIVNTHLDGGASYGIRGQKAIHDISRDPRRFFIRFDATVGAWYYRYAEFDGEAFGLDLIAHRSDMIG